MVDGNQGEQIKTYGMKWAETHTACSKTGIIHSQLMITYEESSAA